MSAQPDRIEEARSWFALAESDLLAASTLFSARPCPWGAVCFHAQQSIEKYLKGILVLRSIVFPRTHDLVLLGGMLGDAPRVLLDNRDLALMNRYAIEGRYPGDWDPIDESEAAVALNTARRIRGVLRATLPGEVLDS